MIELSKNMSEIYPNIFPGITPEEEKELMSKLGITNEMMENIGDILFKVIKDSKKEDSDD